MIDLHTHSTASDGTFSPKALVEEAARVGVSAMALTDHDTLDGVPEARHAGSRVGVEVITGVELGVVGPWDPHEEVHLLGYFVDPAAPMLREALERMREGRRARAPRILARLRGLGVSISLAEVKAQSSGESLGRPHVADALVEAGVVPDRRAAFDRFLADGKPAYVPRDLLGMGEAIAAVRAAGGLPVLAHPGLTSLGPDELAGWLGRLAAEGLVGLECNYPRHPGPLAARYAQLAALHGLVVTGGSDWHGPHKTSGLRLGHGSEGRPIPDQVLDDLRTRLASVRS